MNKIILISILMIITFTSCVKKEVVYFQDDYSNDYNSNSNSYKVSKSKNKIIHKTTKKKVYKKVYKTNHNKVSNKCETEITEIFRSKASGKITICKGKILTGGKKTKVIYVNK